MSPFSPLTALDILGIRSEKDGGVWRHVCQACGSNAWTGDSYTQCLNPSCEEYVATPMDLLAWKLGGYKQAAAALLEASRNPRLATVEIQNEHESGHRVMREWLKTTQTRANAHMITLAAKRKKQGLPDYPGNTGIIIVCKDDIQRLVDVGMSTGAKITDSLKENPPDAATAVAVQSNPYWIDRIVFSLGNWRAEICWRRFQTGFIGLAGASPHEHRFMTHDVRSALQLQKALADVGMPQMVAAVFQDRSAAIRHGDWQPDGDLLCGVIRNPSHLQTFARLCEQHDKFGATFSAISWSGIFELQPRAKPWKQMRPAMIYVNTDPRAKRMPNEIRKLIEECNPTREELAKLAVKFESEGRRTLAEDMRRCAAREVVFRGDKMSIIAAMSDYSMETGSATSPITNFALNLTGGVRFRDSLNVRWVGDMTVGRDKVPISIPGDAIGDSRKLLEVLRSATIDGSTDGGQVLPTIIEPAMFRRYVVPYIHKKTSQLVAIPGADNLGWSLDKQVYFAPGMMLKIDGRFPQDVPFNISSSALALMETKIPWPDGSPKNLPQPAADLVAMVLAMAARFYIGAPSRALCVAQGAEARHLVNTVFRAMGQKRPWEVNPNLRNPGDIPGVRGYPFLATYTGAAPEMLRTPCVILAETGYSVAEEVSEADAMAAGRALQWGLLRVVEWCLAEGAESFVERPAVLPHSAFLREGKWLMENVCNLQPWEVTDLGLAHLESLLAQIPKTDISDRFVLHNGTTIRLDLRGLDYDVDRLGDDLRTLKAENHIEDDCLTVGAVKLSPALEQYYGDDDLKMKVETSY